MASVRSNSRSGSALGGASSSGFSSSSRPQGNSLWNSWYAEYMQRIEQYRGTQYYDILKNNPYASYLPYSPTVGDSIASALGSSAAEDRFYQDRINNAEEYFSQWLAEINQRQYNSTPAAVARDAQAGINDTLSGSTSGQGDAGTPVPDENPPSFDPSDAATSSSLGTIGNIAQLGMSFCNGILGFAKGCQELGMNVIQRSTMLTGMADSMYDFVLKTEADGMEFPSSSINPETGEVDWSSIPAFNVNKPVPAGFSGEQARLYRAMRNSLYDKDGRPTSALQEAWRRRVAGAAKDTLDTAKSFSMPGFSFEDFASFSGKIGEQLTSFEIGMQQFSARLKQLEYTYQLQTSESSIEATNAENGARQSEAEYSLDYYSNMDGSVVAGQDMEDTRFRALQRDLMKITNEYNTWLQKSRRQLIQAVRGSGKWYNNIGMNLLPGLLQGLDNSSQTFNTALSAALKPASIIKK